MSRITISQLASHQLGDVGRLCEQELTLDRSVGSIPRIVTRQPYLGLAAVQDSSTVGACVGSVAQSDGNAEGVIDQSLGSIWQASWIAEITEVLRSTEAGLYVACRAPRRGCLFA
jgi:hypothetical protein